jgi:SAM-dependent methyltransferase
MHYTSLKSGQAFSESYGIPNGLVVDLGGRNVNGSLRGFFEKKGAKFVCVDMDADASVDIVVPPGEKLPFEDGSVDLIVSTSCFEHDPCFWLTFKEMTRLLKLDGFIYINAPSNGVYHSYPGDNWRFYFDAGQALAYWSGVQVATEVVYPVKVIETFHISSEQDTWIDFVCVWKRVADKETNITISPEIETNIGVLEKRVNERQGLKTIKKSINR